jgi:arsenate reductase
MDKTRVLFVCVHNSARSQMAEAFLEHHGGDRFEAYSAGIEPGTLNQDVVEVMKEKGIDISGNKTKSAFEMYKKSMVFTYVITVCDIEAAERCPIFPGVVKRLHWSFADPSSFTGSREEILAKTRTVRDEIERYVIDFIEAIQQERDMKDWEYSPAG